MLEEEIREICLKYWPFDTWIPRKDMIVGATYICKARNFYVVEWTGQGFKYIRYKFGHTFEDIEYHWDDGPPYGTVRPLQKI